MADFVTGHEFALYCEDDPKRWGLIIGCRARYSGIGFGVIERAEGTDRFRIVFGSASSGMETEEPSSVEICVNDFEVDQISHVYVDSLPFSHIRDYLKIPTTRPTGNANAQTRGYQASNNRGSQSTHLQDRVDAIEHFCKFRQIRNIVHFTRIENLESILMYGLYSRADLEAHIIPGNFCFNDNDRADRQRNSVSLSISFPNYKMFYRYHHSHPEKWVVLYIAPEVLWQVDCAFCRENAAASNVTRVSINERRQFTALQNMFDDWPGKLRSELAVPDHFPTNPQAEILAFGQIPPSMITHVNFRNEYWRQQWQDMQRSAIARPKLVVAPELFGPRQDYIHWIT